MKTISDILIPLEFQILFMNLCRIVIQLILKKMILSCKETLVMKKMKLHCDQAFSSSQRFLHSFHHHSRMNKFREEEKKK